MTEEEKKAVEAKEQEAATVQKSDLELKLEAKESELKQVKLDKENYRKLGLKYKKADELDKEATSDTDEDLDSRVERIIAGRLLDNQEKQLLSEKDELLKQALARNSELETAIKNRSQISTSTGTGSSSETKFSPKDGILSDEKIKLFKSQGKTDAWIERFKANLMKQV